MDATELLAAINLLVEEMEHEPDDLHEIHLKLLEHFHALRAAGMPLPEDLVALERSLAADIEGVDPDSE